MSDIKCPFCGAELQEFGGGDFPLLHYCDNINCNLYHIMGQYTLWQELTRTRKALDIAKDAIDVISLKYHKDTAVIFLIKYAQIAKDQITALEQKDE